MGRSLAVAVLAVTGLLCAAGIGVAAYLVSRDSVAVPVTQLQPRPSRSLTPTKARPRKARTATTTTTTTTTAPTTTVDDHGGGSGGSSGHGGGSGGSGGGHGGDD
jgi:uncharacterized membrane protein YgcG